MKKSITAFITLMVILFLFGGLSLLMQFFSIFMNILKYGFLSIFLILPKLPTSIFDILEQVISDNWSLTNIQWLDTTLLNIASIVPSIVIFLITHLGIKIKVKYSVILSFIIFLIVIQLFSSYVFWIIFIGLIVLIIIVLIIINRANIEENIITKNDEINTKEEHEEGTTTIINSTHKNMIKCPICNSKLVRRKGPYGYFWGCSSFPRCNFSCKNIK